MRTCRNHQANPTAGWKERANTHLLTEITTKGSSATECKRVYLQVLYANPSRFHGRGIMYVVSLGTFEAEWEYGKVKKVTKLVLGPDFHRALGILHI